MSPGAESASAQRRLPKVRRALARPLRTVQRGGRVVSLRQLAYDLEEGGIGRFSDEHPNLLESGTHPGCDDVEGDDNGANRVAQPQCRADLCEAIANEREPIGEHVIQVVLCHRVNYPTVKRETSGRNVNACAHSKKVGAAVSLER